MESSVGSGSGLPNNPNNPQIYPNNEGFCRGGGPCSPPPPDPSLLSFNYGFAFGFVIAFVLVIVYFALFSLTKSSDSRTIKRMKLLRIERRKLNIKISTLERVVTRMSFKEISEVTSNFSKENIIGFGNMGTMYKGTLPNGWFLAIKRLHNPQNFKKQFISELLTLGRLRHTNLVPLLGFCTEKKEMLLVYKYISNGTLYDWLHNTRMGGIQNKTDWGSRVKIAVGIARGLAWLHYNSNLQVHHLNITSRCVILDQKFEPKISNFSGALFLGCNDTQSTQDFIVDGEFWEMGFVKKDVHSFGLLLVELITGQDPLKIVNSFSIFNEKDLSVTAAGFYDAIDKRIVGKGNDAEIFQVLKIAWDCVRISPEKRPTMLKVYRQLRTIGERYGIADDSDILSQTEISIFKFGLK